MDLLLYADADMMRYCVSMPQTFSLVKGAEAPPTGAAADMRKGRGVQKAGGLTGLLAKSRSCLELTSVVDDE